MFKALILQHVYRVSDERTEHPIRERHSFSRFLGLLPEDRVSDAAAVWLPQEARAKVKPVKALFGT